MFLFKDYQTSQKSLSVTGLILTFLLVVACIVGAAMEKINENILWFVLAFHGTYVALYWNKRVRSSRDSTEIGGKNE